MMRALLLVLALSPILTQVAGAAYIEVAFRPQNGAPDVATEWAVEMISDTPIGSAGILIPDGPDLTGFTSWNVGGTPVVGLPGVMATIQAVEDPTAQWEYLRHPQPVPFPPVIAGRIINAQPGTLGTALGTVNIWLGLGMLHEVTQMAFMFGEGEEVDLWADDLGNPIPASDVVCTFPSQVHCFSSPRGASAISPCSWTTPGLIDGRGRWLGGRERGSRCGRVEDQSLLACEILPCPVSRRKNCECIGMCSMTK